MTDTHITESLESGSNATKCATLFQEIQALPEKPAFVVATGDLVEAGNPGEYATFRKMLDQSLRLPFYGVAGNHDIRWNPLGKEGFVQGSGQPLHRSWSQGGVHFILLDSTVLLQHWGHFAQSELDWLASDLRRNAGRQAVVIGFHHAVGTDTVQIDNEKAFLDLIRPYNVRLLLMGHGHSDRLWSVDGIPAVMAKGLYEGSYHVVRVRTKEKTLEVLRRTNEAPTLSTVIQVPLSRPQAPTWTVRVAVNRGMGTVLASSKNLQRGQIALPTDAQLSFRVDQGPELPMGISGDLWSGSFDGSTLGPGVHRIRVNALLANEQRAYQLEMTPNLTGERVVTPLATREIGGEVQGHLALDGTQFYVPSMKGALVSYDIEGTSPRWQFTTEGSVFTTPCIDTDAIYIGSTNQQVFALDRKTGKPLWKLKTQGAVLAGGAVAGEIVCFPSADRTIYGIEKATGKVRWMAKGEGLFQSKVATDGERFFVGGWDNQFRCLDAKTGQELWSQKLGTTFYYAPAIGAPVVAEGKVFITSNDGILHAMEVASGKIVWESENLKLGYSSPCFVEGKIICSSLAEDGSVYSFDAATGRLLWSVGTGAVIYDSSVVVSQGIAYVTAVNGTVTAIQTRKRALGKAEPGTLLWQYRLPVGHVFSTPVADRERLIVGSLNGTVTILPLIAPGQQNELAN